MFFVAFPIFKKEVQGVLRLAFQNIVTLFFTFTLSV